MKKACVRIHVKFEGIHILHINSFTEVQIQLSNTTQSSHMNNTKQNVMKRVNALGMSIGHQTLQLAFFASQKVQTSDGVASQDYACPLLDILVVVD